MTDDQLQPDGHEPDCPGGDCDCGRHWALDLEPGATVEDLAGSLIREAEAVAALDASSVWIRRGDGPPMEITPEMRRRHKRGG